MAATAAFAPAATAVGKAPEVYVGVCPLMEVDVTFASPLGTSLANVEVGFTGNGNCVIGRNEATSPTSLRTVTVSGTAGSVDATFSCLGGVARGTVTVTVPGEGGFGAPTADFLLVYYGAGATALLTQPTGEDPVELVGFGSFVQDPREPGGLEDVATCPLDGMSTTDWLGPFEFQSVREIEVA